MGQSISAAMIEVLESASRLQRVVPDAVLVGGSAAALRAGHRISRDHDHVLADLQHRFESVLEAIEAEPDWVTNRVTPGKIILGNLGGVEAGIRQMIRVHPLEIEVVELPSGNPVRVPTREETLRIKAFLVVKRNQVRDYLDVAALSASYSPEFAASVLANIDTYYADQARGDDSVASQLVRQLGNPRPRDVETTKQLKNYKGVSTRWQNWDSVRTQCQDVAQLMVEAELEAPQ